MPQLFTHWWVYWNDKEPDNYSLPDGLVSLSQYEKDKYLARGSLSDNIDEATGIIWEAHKSVISIMLQIYHMRPKDRNDIQHPAPSKASAYAFTDLNTITTLLLSVPYAAYGTESSNRISYSGRNKNKCKWGRNRFIQ